LFNYQDKSIYVVWGRSRCLFGDKYKTYKVWAECTIVDVKPVGASRYQ